MGDAADELVTIIARFQAEFARVGAAKLPTGFEDAARGFLSEHMGEPHAFAPYFDGIAAISETLAGQGRFDDALSLWEAVRRVIARWESAHRNAPGFRPVHLGTLFYFASGLHFEMGNREHALMLMHLALEQDERNMPGEDTAARKFIALDADSPKPYLRPLVVLLADFLKSRLQWYNTFAEEPYNNPYGALTWDEFRHRFLAAGAPLSSVAAFYVFSVAKVHSLWAMIDAFAASRFAARVYENALLNLCIVFEELVRPKYAITHGVGHLPTMKPLIAFLAKQTGLNLTATDLKTVQTARNHNFDAEVTRLISNRGPARGPAGFTWRIEEDLLTMYAVRDPTAHQIRPSSISVLRFHFLSDSILRSIFFVIERLYRT